MIKRELKGLLLNPIMMVVLIAILLIPSIYTIPFLSSMWDPYGRMSELPVAVVNEDQPVMYQEKLLSVGDDLTANLKENDELDFHFINGQKAERGLQDGTYYMTITIPKDFSANAATVMDKDPKEMKLEYKTNPGTNYIASKLCTTAMEKIRTSVSEEVSRTYTQAVFDGFDTISQGMDDAVSGTDQMLDGENELIKGSGQLTAGLGTLKKGGADLYDGAKELKSGVADYTAGVKAVDLGINDLGKGVIRFKQEAGTGASQLSQGSAVLKKGVADYTAGVAAANSGVLKIAANSEMINKGMADLLQGTSDLKAGSQSLYGGLSKMQEETEKALNTQNQQIPVLQTKMNEFGDSLNQLNGLIQNYEEAGAPDIQTELNAVKKQLDQLNTADMTAEQKDAIAAIEGELAAIEGKTSSGAGSAETLQTIKALSGGVQSNYTALKGSVNGGIDPLVKGYGSIDTTLKSMMIPGAGQISGGLAEMEQTIDTVLIPGVKQYTDGVAGVSTGLTALSQKNGELNYGAENLHKGIGTFSQGISQGVTSMEEGVGQISAGTGKLRENSGMLNSGSGSLADGAKQINSGASELAKGSKTLGGGLNALKDGTSDLKTGIADGAEEVRNSKADESSIDMMNKPVELSGQEEHPVPDNGHAMAAYMMSVALWVGALAFCLMYPLTKFRGRLTSGFNWWLSKAIVLYPLAIAMALAMLGLLHRFCGFHPADWKNTILLACVAALAFMSLMYFFNALLGRVGSFIMLVFMIVQLSGAAGTYPIELSGDFVADINPFLPFSYTVTGFRSTISGGEANLLPCYCMLLLILVVFTALSILLFFGRAKKIKAGKLTFHDFMDSRGFA